MFGLTVKLEEAEDIAGYFLQRLLAGTALGQTGTAAAWRWGSDGAVTASLQETSHLAAVSDGALGGPGAALGPGDGSQGAVLANLRDTERGLRLTVSHRAEAGVRAAVAGGERGEVSVRTESRAALRLGAGQAQTVQAQPGVGAAVTGGHRGHSAVPAVVNLAVRSLAVPGAEQGAGTTPARGGGRH